MAARTRKPERRGDALSRERIVDTAIAMLDAAGEAGLTFRALSAELRTGPGAIYWHVASKDEILIAATAAALGAATAYVPDDTPENTIRAVALGVFDAIAAHPWVGSELSRTPSPPPILRIFEQLGRQVQALGVPQSEQFAVASALFNYIIGVGGQHAALARAVAPETDRTEYLTMVAAAWADLDSRDYSFLQNVAGQMREHDDRVQFLDGVDLIIAGISSRWRT
jgi:AcrR family transcriptional regulator